MAAKITAVELKSVIEYLESRPEIARRAARMAINDTTQRKAMPMFRKSMQEQVAFPAGYLNEDRFGVRKPATDADLTAVISARFRPTSLARFAQGQSAEGAKRTGGVRVRVNRGGAKFMKGAFFVNLRRGKDTSDGFNVGLAIRLKPGQTLKGRRRGAAGVQLAEDLYLLYGPSVDQVFNDVSTADSPAVAVQLEREFLRQWVRLNATTA
jgi:hypothetical protein